MSSPAGVLGVDLDRAPRGTNVIPRAVGAEGKSDIAIAIDASQGIAFPLDPLSGTTRTKVIDRWIYVFTATSFIVIVLTGFVPDSIARIARAGTLAPFLLALHFHAVLMGSFLLLLLGQTVLVAMDKRNWHMQLGIAAVDGPR
jgi:lysylphosphatidylglycerol synthetase-like protein (DUF2156 family)